MHCRTFYRQRRGDRTLAEASQATGINEGTLSRIERGEQFPARMQVVPLVNFYDVAAFWAGGPWLEMLRNLYPPSVLRVLQNELVCSRCGKPLPPESRANRRRHEVCP
jgi:transcriptional regulator with XRE-family HTH domain